MYASIYFFGIYEAGQILLIFARSMPFRGNDFYTDWVETVI